jgi:protein-S-isoprenylcysteine O-methyltransferase Ste14
LSPQAVDFVLWNLFALSWLAAALWSRRAAARPAFGLRIADGVVTVAGAWLLFFGSSSYSPLVNYAWVEAGYWPVPAWAGWAAVAVTLSGFAFAWWARVTLGDLWSGNVSRKEGHVIVRSGPYGLVRHPIYTGIILSAFATGYAEGMAVNVAGAALITLGFWMKARLEERFLSVELGPAYAAYRAATPMLAPFWPTGR